MDINEIIATAIKDALVFIILGANVKSDEVEFDFKKDNIAITKKVSGITTCAQFEYGKWIIHKQHGAHPINKTSQSRFLTNINELIWVIDSLNKVNISEL